MFGANVTARAADAQCRPAGEIQGGLTNEQGEFEVMVVRETASAEGGCVVLEATHGGAAGQGSVPVVFRSSSAASPAPSVNIRLGKAPALIREAADEMIHTLRNAIGSEDRAFGRLVPFIRNGPEAFRVALEDSRKLLGEVVATKLVDESVTDRDARFEYELLGSNGRTLRTTIYQSDTRFITNPLIYYSLRGSRFVSIFLRLVETGDVQRMSRLLNPDDVDVSEGAAQKVIDYYRTRIDPGAGVRFEFADLDESRASLRYRVNGTKDGKPVEFIMDFAYGDGLLGLRGWQEAIGVKQ